MKSARKSRSSKPTYFRKDYAPAQFLAEQKRANTLSGKVSKKVRTAAASAGKKLSQAAATVRQKSAAHAARTTKTSRPQSDLLHKYIHPKSRKSHRTQTSRKSSRRPALTWREISLMSMIGASAVAIAITFIFSNIYDPVKRSQRELEKIAYDYYIEYLYPYSLGRNIDRPETVLADYVAQGLPAVKLRQLLLYNNGKHADSAEVFSNAYYECDKNQTYVRYYPVEPYGPRDFTVTYGPSCEKIGSIN